MLIGAINDPRLPLETQIEWMGRSGFDFIDLTLEGPYASSWKINVPAIKDLLKKSKLQIVGHTSPTLPVASPVEELREAAVLEFRRCMNVFHKLGARWMNVHPALAAMHDRKFSIQRNVQSLQELVSYGKELGVGVMVENLWGGFNTAQELGEVLSAIPELGLHLDIGHANLMTSVNTTVEILAAHGNRLKHVHLHDNRGGNLDLHLPLGAGELDLAGSLSALKSCGYDGTITLEVFSADRNLLVYSRDVLKQTWRALDKQSHRQAAGSA